MKHKSYVKILLNTVTTHSKIDILNIKQNLIYAIFWKMPPIICYIQCTMLMLSKNIKIIT